MTVETTITTPASVFDPFVGLDDYMKSRLNEFFGPEFVSYWPWFNRIGTEDIIPTQITGDIGTAYGQMDTGTTTTGGGSMITTDLPTGTGLPTTGTRPRYSQMYSPIRLDIKETDTKVIVGAEIAGTRKEDIRVFVDDRHVLHIEANVPNPLDPYKENEKLLLSERRYGKVKRSIRLPKNADGDNVSTTFENGLLCLVFDKKEEKRKQIEIS